MRQGSYSQKSIGKQNRSHGSLRQIDMDDEKQVKNYEGLEFGILQTSQSNQAIEDEAQWIKKYKNKADSQKVGHKNVKIKFDMSSSQEKKSNSCRNITSMQRIEQQTDRQSIDQLNLMNGSINQGWKLNGSILVNDNNSTMNRSTKIGNKSYCRSEKSIKSNKCIKFSDKKDVFTYKSEMKSKSKQKSKKAQSTEEQVCCPIF